MPISKRETGGGPKKTAKKSITKKDGEAGTGKKVAKLSTKRFTPSGALSDFNILIYGEPKIGKTLLADQFPGAYFFLFEPNDSYPLLKSDITDWDQFEELVDQFIGGGHDAKTAVCDGMRTGYDIALASAGAKHGFDHPGGMNDRGSSWDKVKKTFVRPLRKLMSAKTGSIFVCHEYQKDIETASGRTFVKVQPDLSGQASSFVVGNTYNIFYYHYDEGKRWLQIEGDEFIVAGHRMLGHFRTTKGEPVYRIPMGSSPEEAFANLRKAFDNKQTEAFRPKGGETSDRDKVAKFKKGTGTKKTAKKTAKKSFKR